MQLVATVTATDATGLPLNSSAVATVTASANSIFASTSAAETFIESATNESVAVEAVLLQVSAPSADPVYVPVAASDVTCTDTCSALIASELLRPGTEIAEEAAGGASGGAWEHWWEPGSLVAWDNRFMLHSTTSPLDWVGDRLMHRIRLPVPE